MLPCGHPGAQEFQVDWKDQFSSSVEDEMDWGSTKSGRKVERLCNVPRKIDNEAYCSGSRTCISVSRPKDDCTNPHLYVSFLFLRVLWYFSGHGSNILAQCKHTHTDTHTRQILFKYEHSTSG